MSFLYVNYREDDFGFYIFVNGGFFMRKLAVMKLMFGIGVILVFALVGALTAFAADEVPARTDVEIAGELGLLIGDGNGLTDEYLAKPTTRLQAAIMFLRLKGLED